MSIPSISYSNYQYSIYNQQNNYLRKTPQISKNEIAFKGLKTATTNTVKKNSGSILSKMGILGAAILGLFGLKSPEEKPVETSTSKPLENVDKPVSNAVETKAPPFSYSDFIQQGDDIVASDKTKCSTYKPLTPSKNHLPGYRLPNGDIDYKKFSQFLINSKRAPLTRENAVVKKMIDFLPSNKIETLHEDYPLFTQYFLNALELGIAESKTNIEEAMEYTFSDSSLVRKIEKYLEKGFKLNSLLLTDIDRIVSINANLPKVIDSYSYETQEKYIKFILSSDSDRYNSTMRFILENIPGEGFLLKSLDDYQTMDLISKSMAEAMKPFSKRTASKTCHLKFSDLVKEFDYSKVQTELTLMKMKYPDKYDQLIKSPQFEAILWNKKTSILKLLENINHELPVTSTSAAGLEITPEIIKTKYSSSEIAGTVKRELNLSKNIRTIKDALIDYTNEKGYTYRIAPKNNGGTQITIINSSGKIELIFESSQFNSETIGIVKQKFYDSFGNEKASLAYESAGNKFTVTSNGKNATLNSLSEFRAQYPELSRNLSRELSSFIFINDDGYQTRKNPGF